MKATIHPTYYPKAKVTCNCGNSFEVGATVETIHVEICSACHPFYTGKQNLVDTAGRVDKFKERTQKATAMKATAAAKKAKKDDDDDQTTTALSQKEKLKEMRKALIQE